VAKTVRVNTTNIDHLHGPYKLYYKHVFTDDGFRRKNPKKRLTFILRFNKFTKYVSIAGIEELSKTGRIRQEPEKIIHK
jgi:hypothetical protein